MLYKHLQPEKRRRRAFSPAMLLALLMLGGVTLVTLHLKAQDQPAQKPQQEAPPEAGGPQTDIGPYAIPKKKEEPPEPRPEKPKKIEGMPDYSLRVDVPLVNVDVLVTKRKISKFLRTEPRKPSLISTPPKPRLLRFCWWSSPPPVIRSWSMR
jgi:hypothetical protein